MISRFLKNLTGPSLEDPDPERRLRAVERLGPETPAEDLAEFVRGETDAGVRVACVARIDEAPILLALMEHEPANGAARDRLAALIEAGLDVPALLAQLDDLALIRHLLDATSAEADWQAVLGRIDGEDLLAEIASHHRSSPVRAAAAARLVHEDALRQVERIARSRDKDVARSVRERLESLRTARQQADTLLARLRELAAEAGTLARSEEEARLAARMERLRGQRDAVVGEHADLAAAFAPFEQTPPPLPDELVALDRNLQTVADRIAAAAEAERAEQDRLAAEAARHETLVAAAGTMERLATELTGRLALSGTPQAEISSVRSALELEEARWRDALGDDPAPAGLAERQAEARARVDRQLAVLDRIRELPAAPEVPAPESAADAYGEGEGEHRLPRSAEEAAPLWERREVLRGQLASLDAWLQQVDWPGDLERPPVVAGVEARAGELRAVIADLDAVEQRLADRIGKLCARLERALDAKKLKPAAGMHADLQRQLPTLPDTDERRRQRVERIRERLDELRDWEYFATAPKREALCSEMESLAGDPEVAPDERAAKVKTLRADWKALGPLRGDEGRALAARFDAAAEQAFAPARAHFEAASEQRAENTRNRERICDELEQFLDGCDWDAADWKTVDRIYRRAREDWQRFADVDARGRSLGKRYHRLTRTLRGHLEGRWKANIARKEALVEAARALVDESGTPVPAAAAEAKRLQAEWKAVDITPRSADRELWKAFRAACDAVFKGLDASREAQVQDHEACRLELEQATRALETAVADLRDGQPGAAQPDASAIDALPAGPVHAALDALRGVQVPASRRKADDATRRAARDALDAIGALRTELDQRRRRARGRTALELDLALASGDRSLESVLAEPPDLPPPWLEALEARPEKVDTTEERRIACVDLELALGLESPEADAALRMQRQVERLSSGMRGEGDDDPASRINEAICRLLACPATTATDLELSRRALGALAGRTGTPEGGS
jgi:hypothetical protein